MLPPEDQNVQTDETRRIATATEIGGQIGGNFTYAQKDQCKTLLNNITLF